MSKIKQAIGITLFESDDFGGPKVVGGGICPTQRAEKVCCGVIEVMETEKKIGNIFGFTGGNYAGNVYDKDHLSPTLNTMQGGCKQPMIVEANSIRMVRTEEGKALRKQYENHEIHHGFNEHREPELRKDGVTNTLSTVQKDNYICVAMRGRNPTNPSDRTPGIELEQTLEVNQNGTTNCLTSVQKDNLVLEKPVLLGGVGEENEFGTQYRQGNRVYSSNAVAMCLNSQPVGNTGGNSYLYNVNYRIRKLTPRECWRLMDFSDEDFEKAAEVNSNTQLYKQAGNSIVVNVLVAILGQLLQGKENVYKELSE